MEKVYVFGHRLPDTDSVTAAITLANLRKELGVNAVPAVLSSLNLETKFVLDYFKVDEPIFLNDVKIKVKDLNYTKNYTIYKEDSIYDAYLKMSSIGISKIPVVDDNKEMLGIVSMRNIAEDQISGSFNLVDTNYDNIVKTIKGHEILRFDNIIKGNLMVAAYRSNTFLSEVKLTSNDIIIMGDRYNILDYAIESGVGLIVITGGHKVPDLLMDKAKKMKVNIISTDYTTSETTRIFNLSNSVRTIVQKDNYVVIHERDNLSDFISIANKTRYSYYPVLNKKEKCLGILRFSDVSYSNKKKVILVDHNSYEQSAIGLDEATIMEIVDHHNIGTIGTNAPISFRNMPVGSTNTIIYVMYKENNVSISREMAGLMLSGILSDTLVLTSPTTTDLDREVVNDLANIVNIDYKKYGFDMIKAGTSLKGKTKDEILHTDFKVYSIDHKNVGLAQIFTTNIDEVEEDLQEYIDLLNTTSEEDNLYFVALFVTDIINNGSYVIYSNRGETIIKNSFGLNEIKELSFLPGIVSRKKQVVPEIINDMESSIL